MKVYMVDIMLEPGPILRMITSEDVATAFLEAFKAEPQPKVYVVKGYCCPVHTDEFTDSAVVQMKDVFSIKIGLMHEEQVAEAKKRYEQSKNEGNSAEDIE